MRKEQNQDKKRSLKRVRVACGCIVMVLAGLLWATAHKDAPPEAEKPVLPAAAAASYADAGAGEPQYSTEYAWLFREALPQEKVIKPIGNREQYVVPAPVEVTARELLESFQAAQTYEVVESDYLDLFGSVWSCIIQEDVTQEVLFITVEQADYGENASNVYIAQLSPQNKEFLDDELLEQAEFLD